MSVALNLLSTWFEPEEYQYFVFSVIIRVRVVLSLLKVWSVETDGSV